MAELDLFAKFNRGFCLALADVNLIEAVQLYNQYISYLKTLDKSPNVTNEISNTKVVFTNKLLDFIQNKKNADKLPELIIAYKTLLEVFPDECSLLKSCAECFMQIEQIDIALELLGKVEKLEPDDIENKTKIFYILTQMKRYEHAKRKAEEIASITGETLDSKIILSQACHNYYLSSCDENYLKKAVINAEIAYKINPVDYRTLKNLTVIYQYSRNEDKLEKIWQEFIKSGKMDYDDWFDYSCFLFEHGKIKEAFKYYESRINSGNKLKNYPIEDRKMLYQKSKGKCKTLLIQAEQGYGDSFMFSRYLPLMKNKVEKIVFRGPKIIQKVLQRSFPDIKILAEETDSLNSFHFDCHIPLMSVPYILGIDKNDTVFKEKYIFADPEKTEYFKNKYLDTGKLNICFNFEGNLLGKQSRNVPLKEFEPLFDIEGTKFFAIQYGKKDDTYKNMNITNLADELRSFDETAAIIEACDLLITVDNSVMNLAGAMNKKTFCIFNSMPDFRWYNLKGDNVVWYKSVKPYQAEKRNEFQPVIQQIKHDIESLIK